MKPQTILVPMDYTGCAYEVAAALIPFAARIEADIVLLHVVRVPLGVASTTMVHPVDGDPRPLIDLLDEDAHDHLEPLAEMFTAVGCRVRLAIRHGNPADAILEAASDVEAAIIAMGTHGRTGLRRLFEGSVAESVVRRATCPVMTIRTQSPDLHGGPTEAQVQAEAETMG